MPDDRVLPPSEVWDTMRDLSNENERLAAELATAREHLRCALFVLRHGGMPSEIDAILTDGEAYLAGEKDA